jgi:hypothetical protein
VTPIASATSPVPFAALARYDQERCATRSRCAAWGKLMRTGTGVFAALTWFLVAAPALSAAHAEPLTHLYTVAVDVDAQGHVAGTTPAADTPAPIAAILDQALKQWRFAPVMQDGHAASVHSYLVADVQALPAGDGKYGVRVGYVGVGPSYQKPAGGKGPDYPQQVLQALIEGGRSQGGAAIAVDLTLPPGGKLATTDAHVTTRAELNMREKLTLIAAVKRYLLQGSVQPELVDGRAVTANLQTSIVVSLFPVESATTGLNHDQATTDQAANLAAARQDAAQSQSVLKPGMVDTVSLQP